MTTLPRVPSVNVVSRPAALAPGEESPGVFLLPDLYHLVFYSLKKGRGGKTFFFFFSPDSVGFRHKSVLGPLIIVAPSEDPDPVQVADQV